MSRWSIIILVTIVLLSCFLSACAFFGSGNPVAYLKINAAEYLNPDINGNAAPVVVDIYQLQKKNIFMQLDYATLSQNSAKALGNELVDKNMLYIRPSMHKEMSVPLSLETNYIGIVAYYRDINHVSWRKVIPVEPKKNKNITIEIALKSQALSVKNVN